MRLVDTAGIRDALDEAESIGVRKSLEALADADIVLVVLDITQMSDAEFEADLALIEKTKGRPRILVCSKADLHTEDRGIVTKKLAASGPDVRRARSFHLGANRRRD